MEFISRQSWGARYGVGHQTTAPQSGVVIHHDPLRHTTDRTTEAQERQIMQIIEQHAVDRLTGSNPRISYQWAAAHSGRIYQGLGWNRIGAHVANANTPNLGIFLMLDGRTNEGSPAMWRAVSEIIREGILVGALIERPSLFGHRDLVSTNCPGDAVMRKLRSFNLNSLLALSIPDVVPSGTRVWSDFFGEHLIVTQYVSDSEWYFIRESQLRSIPSTRATALYSRMPEARP